MGSLKRLTVLQKRLEFLKNSSMVYTERVQYSDMISEIKTVIDYEKKHGESAALAYSRELLSQAQPALNPWEESFPRIPSISEYHEYNRACARKRTISGIIDMLSEEQEVALKIL